MESRSNLFLTNYLDHLDLDLFVESIDHLELLNTNLNFFFKYSSDQNDNLINFLEQLFRCILKKDQIEFCHVELNFITIFCRLLSKFNRTEKISSLILENELIGLESKVDIVQCLLTEKLVDNSNCLFYINFVFSSLSDLFDSIQKSQHTQQTTKLMNSIIWILFDFVKNDLHSDHLIEGCQHFLEKISIQSNLEDNQLVDFVLDFIASLVTFCTNEINSLKEQIKVSSKSESINRLKCIEKIKSAIRIEKIDEIIVNSTLNIASTSIRKKSRYICDQLNLLPLIAVELLETLEEKQLHLVQPFIDKKLNSPALKSKLSMTSFRTVLELIILRMLNHDCKHVKLYAFKFIQDLYTSNQFEFISEQFILDPIITTLQNNLIYDENFFNESMSCLGSISTEKILKSLLDKEDHLSSHGLYFITKQIFLSNFHSDEKLSHHFDIFKVQRLLNLPKLIGERSIRSVTQIYLVKLLIRNLDANEIQFLLNVLFCVNTSEIQIQNLDLNKDQTFQIDCVDLNNSCQLIGLARYFAINYTKSIHLDQLYHLLKRLQSMSLDHLNSFFINFLNVLIDLDVTLWNKLNEAIDVFEHFDILKLICSKAIDKKVIDEISQLLITKIRSEIEMDRRLEYVSLLDKMNTRDQIRDEILSNSSVQLEITNDTHWNLLNRFLSDKLEINLDQIICLLNHNTIESYELKLDFLINLISRTPVEINIQVIEFIGHILNAELTNHIPFEETLILQNKSIFDDLLFKSCLEIRKVWFYQKVFKHFIERIAFPVNLFVSKKCEKLFNDQYLDELNSLFDKLLDLNTLEIKSILIDHINKVIDNDLVRSEWFEKLLIKNLENGCLLDKKFQVLNDHLKYQISTDAFLNKCLNFEMNLDFYKETRIKSIFTSLKLDHDKQSKLINKIVEKEVELQNSKNRNYPNSTNNRTQVKIWQFILIVTLKTMHQKTKDDSEMLRSIYELTLRSIVKQSSTQTSVRLLQQLIIIVLIKDEQCPAEFYEQFKSMLSFESKSDYLSGASRNYLNEVNKIGHITSLLSIVFHLLKSKPELKYYPINYLINCNHYKTRLFSHLVLVENNMEINLSIDQFDPINPMPKSISGSNNIIKNFNLLRGDWFFSALDCNNDINLQFIFYLLPKLTNLIEDDFIDLSLLSKHYNQNFIKLQNPDSKLLSASYTDYARQCRTLEFEECPNNSKEIFQKKYIGPQFNMETNKRKSVGELIICASLIDRPPNLGGLARTSEIFGVRKLIIPNNKIMKDKEFLNLSVTAEKWIDIEECFPWDLVSYLRDLKANHNYTLIALEQSTESVCLTKFQFPVKSLILLGNEKEGLPIELLSMVDYCVEIPQTGIIKSLNVHVSGALCAFEYFKQQNFKQ